MPTADGRCGFTAKRVRGPPVVPRPVQSFIDGWREYDTWDSLSERDKVTVNNDLSIYGVFYGVCGDVDFEGERGSTVIKGSGYEAWYYHEQWREYGL